MRIPLQTHEAIVTHPNPNPNPYPNPTLSSDPQGNRHGAAARARDAGANSSLHCRRQGLRDESGLRCRRASRGPALPRAAHRAQPAPGNPNPNPNPSPNPSPNPNPNPNPDPNPNAQPAPGNPNPNPNPSPNPSPNPNPNPNPDPNPNAQPAPGAEPAGYPASLRRGEWHVAGRSRGRCRASGAPPPPQCVRYLHPCARAPVHSSRRAAPSPPPAYLPSLPTSLTSPHLPHLPPSSLGRSSRCMAIASCWRRA